MQKVIKFLEAYVQWIAVALGILWVLWMGYSYWGANPVAADLGGQKVAPGDVEEEIIKSVPVDSLDKAKRNEGPYPEPVQKVLRNRDQKDYVKEFLASAAAGGGLSPDVASSPFAGGTIVIPTPGQDKGEENGGSTLPNITGVLALETNATGDAVQSGMSVVKRPDPTVPVVPNPAGGQAADVIQPPDTNLANLNNANAAVNPAAPGQPQVPTAPAPIAVVPEEVTWVTVGATLDMKKLAMSFQQANIAQIAALTSILRVELVREEQMPGGQFGNQVVVKDLTNQFKPAMPDNQANAADQALYLQWAQQHVADIVQPPFYEVLRGQLWKTAIMQDVADPANAQPQVAQFDPATVKPGEVSSLPPEQRAAWLKWNKEQEAAKHPAPAPKTTPATGGRGGGRGASFFAPTVASEAPLSDGATRGRLPARTPRTETPAAQQPGLYVPNAGPAAAAQPQELPTSPFSPAQQQKDLEIWAHDESTVPDKVYRYKVRIWIKNPLWATQQMAKNPTDANVFGLMAETDWSKPVPSPSKRDFFVSSGGSTVGGVPKVSIEYFKWEDGSWKKSTVSLQPGDRVGETSWTVVDLRPIGNSNGDNRVLLVSDTGDVVSRFYKTDKARPEYPKLTNLANQGAPPPGATGTQTPTPGVTPGRTPPPAGRRTTD